MKVLVACERSGVVRRSFAARGHDAWSCDLEPAADADTKHVVSDARALLGDPAWDLVIAHPPCTRLTLSGLRWLYERGLWKELREAAEFFRFCVEAPAERTRVCVENPKMHRHARELVPTGPQQWVEPWFFGDPWTKKTGLWLRNLPPLMSTAPVAERYDRIHRMPAGPDRGRLRAVTPPGLAGAMALQWG